MAIAKASAESADWKSQPGKRVFIIICTCSLDACPDPTSDFFIKFGEYSETCRPNFDGTNKAIPRACPNFSVEAGFTLTNVSSTAASIGRNSSITRRRQARITLHYAVTGVNNAITISFDNTPTRIT